MGGAALCLVRGTSSPESTCRAPIGITVEGANILTRSLSCTARAPCGVTPTCSRSLGPSRSGATRRSPGPSCDTRRSSSATSRTGRPPGPERRVAGCAPAARVAATARAPPRAGVGPLRRRLRPRAPRQRHPPEAEGQAGRPHGRRPFRPRARALARHAPLRGGGPPRGRPAAPRLVGGLRPLGHASGARGRPRQCRRSGRCPAGRTRGSLVPPAAARPSARGPPRLSGRAAPSRPRGPTATGSRRASTCRPTRPIPWPAGRPALGLATAAAPLLERVQRATREGRLPEG